MDTRTYISKKVKEKIFWTTEHLFFPMIISVFAILLNNYYQDQKNPNLISELGKYQVDEIKKNEFKIKCPFSLVNIGGHGVKKSKVTFLTPEGFKIENIIISNEYKSYYNMIGGGVGFNYFLLEVDLPKDKNIDGHVILNSNISIPEDAICPLRIIK